MAVGNMKISREKKWGCPVRAMLVCASVHHGNTERVARAIGDVLGAEILTPAGARGRDLSGCRLVGFGSGIYAFRHHPSLLRAAADMPLRNRPTFIFSTYGFGVPALYHRALRLRMRRGGARILGEFSCPGHDTFGPLRLIGGINRGRPNAEDLARAREFAADLAARMA